MTMTFLFGPSPSQGAPWLSFFSTNVTQAVGAVAYFVDVDAAPSGCLPATWTAVSANTSAVQLSPPSGNGSSRVEIFPTTNTGPARSTAVTIAGQTATLTQAGR